MARRRGKIWINTLENQNQFKCLCHMYIKINCCESAKKGVLVHSDTLSGKGNTDKMRNIKFCNNWVPVFSMFRKSDYSQNFRQKVISLFPANPRGHGVGLWGPEVDVQDHHRHAYAETQDYCQPSLWNTKVAIKKILPSYICRNMEILIYFLHVGCLSWFSETPQSNKLQNSVWSFQEKNW
jgi:hypothetical protein